MSLKAFQITKCNRPALKMAGTITQAMKQPLSTEATYSFAISDMLRCEF